MGVEMVDPPAQKLAGKRTEGPVMRNGAKRTCPRSRDATSISEVVVAVVDACSIDRAREQRLNALGQADQVRLHRAEIRRRMARLELDFDEFLDEPPASCAKVAVSKVLQWLPRIGPERAVGIVARLGTDSVPVTEATRLHELAARDKYLLSQVVREHLGWYERTYLKAA